jgi:hypothetical protein
VPTYPVSRTSAFAPSWEIAMSDFDMSVHGVDCAGDLLPDSLVWGRVSVVVNAPKGCFGDPRRDDRGADDRAGWLAC